MSGGRPNEGRERKVIYVLPLTDERIEFLVDKTKPDANTPGKVIDSQFGVRASKKVAGAGRKAPRGQHGRAKQKQSRAHDPSMKPIMTREMLELLKARRARETVTNTLGAARPGEEIVPPPANGYAADEQRRAEMCLKTGVPQEMLSDNEPVRATGVTNIQRRADERRRHTDKLCNSPGSGASPKP